MDITVDSLKTELEAMKKQQAEMVQNLNALAGAIQLAEYLIQKAETPAKVETPVETKPEVGADSTIHTEADVATA